MKNNFCKKFKCYEWVVRKLQLKPAVLDFTFVWPYQKILRPIFYTSAPLPPQKNLQMMTQNFRIAIICISAGKFLKSTFTSLRSKVFYMTKSNFDFVRLFGHLYSPPELKLIRYRNWPTKQRILLEIIVEAIALLQLESTNTRLASPIRLQHVFNVDLYM